MDKRAKYIEMLTAASEIQAQRQAPPEVLKEHGDQAPSWQEGDFWVCNIRGHLEFGVCCDQVDNPYAIMKPIWLPRLDQYLEMVRDGSRMCYDRTLLRQFNAYIEQTGMAYEDETAEELALRWSMSVVYQKSWNGVRWVR